MIHLRPIWIVLALATGAGLALAENQKLSVERERDAIVVKNQDGVIMLQYQLTQPAGSGLSVDSACYFHPFATPQGVVLTDVAPPDHPHHRGIFQAWVEVRGRHKADFWGWGEPAPTRHRIIQNEAVEALAARGPLATMRCRNAWKAEDDTMLEETVIAILRQIDGVNVLDLDFILRPTEDLTLAQWAFSGFCVRSRPDGQASIRDSDGQVSLPTPVHTEPETDWPDAPWYALDLQFEDGKSAGIAVLNHPQNPPTLWHNHAGLRMLNPCITAPGDVLLKGGQRFTLRYRLVAYDGKPAAPVLQKLHDRWKSP